MQRQKFVLSIFSLTLLLLLTGCNPKSTEPMVPPVNFVFVKGGRFDNGYADIKISSFFLAKHALSQADYEAVMGINPAFDHGVGSNFPVYYVTWFNAIEYCNRRSILEGLTPCYSYGNYGTDTGGWPTNWGNSNSNHSYVSCNWAANGYRLLTEMEWMFAARGGNLSHNYIYSGSNNLDHVGWYGGNNDPAGTKPVGSKAPNELGLYDMSGNIWELVWDIHGGYPGGAQNDPTGAMYGNGRLSRGGSWVYDASYCTVSFRNFSYPTDSTWNLGFRVCRAIP